MVVQVRLFATFREGRFNEEDLELPDGISVGGLLDRLKIPVKDAKIIILNGIAASAEQELNDQDIIAIFPPIAGG